MHNRPLKGVSLFCSAGIGDLAIRELGVDVIAANELKRERATLYKRNFPETKVIVGDIWETRKTIVNETKNILHGAQLDVLFATPPCQGMSKNGRGKLLSAIRAGEKRKLDPRNQLIIPTINICKELRPRLFLMENVPELERTTIISEHGLPISIIDYIKHSLGEEYQYSWKVIEFADYGVPQCRQRLIFVATRDKGVANLFKRANSFAAPATHSKEADLLGRRWISIDAAIGHLPPLDAGSPETASSDIPHHEVPLLDKDKYFWVSNTPPEKGAFDNQCVSPGCGYKGNATHTTAKCAKGINRASRKTPIYCEECGALLPRPWVVENGAHRLMSGYTSAYKRMRAHEPASALTRNLSYACSDKKLHPHQNRVLSLKEAFIIHTIDQYAYHWENEDGKAPSKKTVREVIGESIPPKGFQIALGDIFLKLASPSAATKEEEAA